MSTTISFETLLGWRTILAKDDPDRVVRKLDKILKGSEFEYKSDDSDEGSGLEEGEIEEDSDEV